MRRLYLSDNEINEIGRGTFNSINRIGTIDLARNRIKKIDFQMFNQLQYAEVKKSLLFCNQNWTSFFYIYTYNCDFRL